MWLLVITLWVQNNLDVDLVSVRYQTFDGAAAEMDCRRRAITENGPVPLQRGNAARWQSADCVKVRG